MNLYRLVSRGSMKGLLAQLAKSVSLLNVEERLPFQANSPSREEDKAVPSYFIQIRGTSRIQSILCSITSGT